MAGRRFAKLGKVRLALLLAGGLSTALTTLAAAPAGSATPLAGRGEEHHEWFNTPPTNQDAGGGNGTTAPCIQYRRSTVRAVTISGSFDVPTSLGTTSHPASPTSPIIVTVDIVNNGALGNVKHYEGPDGTYTAFTAPPAFPPVDFSGGCTGSVGAVVNTDPGTTPVPTVTQGTSSTNLCSNATAISIKREVVASPSPHQVRTVVFTCKDPSVASSTTHTLTATGLPTGLPVPADHIDPVCNPPLMSLDCVLSTVTIT